MSECVSSSWFMANDSKCPPPVREVVRVLPHVTVAHLRSLVWLSATTLVLVHSRAPRAQTSQANGTESLVAGDEVLEITLTAEIHAASPASTGPSAP